MKVFGSLPPFFSTPFEPELSPTSLVLQRRKLKPKEGRDFFRFTQQLMTWIWIQKHANGCSVASPRLSEWSKNGRWNRTLGHPGHLHTDSAICLMEGPFPFQKCVVMLNGAGARGR